MAAVAIEAGRQFVDDDDPEINRTAARAIYAAVQERLKTTDGLALLQTICSGLREEFTEAEAGGVDARILRLTFSTTYRSVEFLLLSLASAG